MSDFPQLGSGPGVPAAIVPQPGGSHPIQHQVIANLTDWQPPYSTVGKPVPNCRIDRRRLDR